MGSFQQGHRRNCVLVRHTDHRRSKHIRRWDLHTRVQFSMGKWNNKNRLHFMQFWFVCKHTLTRHPGLTFDA